MNKSAPETVCLALGPYRNLTTLTASLLFLHPRCQVLNHGSDRILPDPRINFLLDYSDARFEAFVSAAIELSASGKRGRYGGSITLSHAFDDKQIQDAYSSRFKDVRVKENIDCLFWKESLRVTDFIRKHNVNLREIFEQNDKLRFLMPIRNPIDCTLSNLKTGRAKDLVEESEGSLFTDVLDAILQDIDWFLSLQARYPERFFCFYENAFNREMVCEMAEFLRLDCDPGWVDDVMSNYNIRHPYEHTNSMKTIYAGLVKQYFESRPQARRPLETFLDQSGCADG